MENGIEKSNYIYLDINSHKTQCYFSFKLIYI